MPKDLTVDAILRNLAAQHQAAPGQARMPYSGTGAGPYQAYYPYDPPSRHKKMWMDYTPTETKKALGLPDIPDDPGLAIVQWILSRMRGGNAPQGQ